MSALLPIAATELNIMAEYGYSARTFSKHPSVYPGQNARSCLFLVYQQERALPNRVPNYRNHFVLYVGAEDLIVARVETTIQYLDNDAVIVYDRIRPSAAVADRFRSRHKCWTVSFDRCTYSAECPKSMYGYEMLCSGEWYYFDKGVILNGVTRYIPTAPCLSMFIYYELHIEHRLVHGALAQGPGR